MDTFPEIRWHGHWIWVAEELIVPTGFRGPGINPNAPGGRGATTGGDPAAWADSIREVLAFFRTHLQRPAP